MEHRKALTEAYKQIKPRIGIFQIRNTANRKVLIERSLKFDSIYNHHRTELIFGSHRNADLQRDWQTFGERAFVFEVLDEIEYDDTQTLDYEKAAKTLAQMYVDERQPFGAQGYHLSKK